MPGLVFLIGGYGNTLPQSLIQSSGGNRVQLGRWTMTVSMNFNIHLVFDGGKSGDGGTVITTKALIRVGQFM